MDDWRLTLETLLHTSLSLGATQADAVWFDNVDVSLSCRKGTLEGLERSESRAIVLRSFVGQSQAIVSSTDISLKSLKNLAASSVGMAKIAPPDAHAGLAPSKLYPKSLPLLDLCEDEEPSAEWLFSQAQEAEASALSIAGITNSEGADANHSRSNIGLMIAFDKQVRFAQHYSAGHSSLSTSVLAGSGVDMQRDYDFSTARHLSDLRTARSIGESAAHRAIRRLNPRKIASGTMAVLYDKRVSKQLVSALASAINGSNIVRGASFLRNDMGKQIFSKAIQITDDPLRVRGLASKPFDGEGVATSKRNIIENGVLTSWFLDMRSSNALGLATTGHATRGMGGPPSPSATNLYLSAGLESPEALMRHMKNGLFITETFGTGINTITGDYSQGASGFLIENGEVTVAVAEITIAGNLRDMFARMIPANDLTFEYATNAPSVMIEGMAVAGA
jgi:PmbA protein